MSQFRPRDICPCRMRRTMDCVLVGDVSGVTPSRPLVKAVGHARPGLVRPDSSLILTFDKSIAQSQLLLQFQKLLAKIYELLTL